MNIFRKSMEKIQISLKSDKNNWYFTRGPPCSTISHWIIFYNEKYFRPTNFIVSQCIL